MQVNIIAPNQVAPGAILKIRVSIANTQEISSFQSRSTNIAGQTQDLKNIPREEKKTITINGINYEDPFQIGDKKPIHNLVSIPSKQEKKISGMKLAPSGNAIKLREELRKEFDNKRKSEKLSDDEILSYVESEKELKKIIEDGRNSIVLELPVPEKFPIGKILTIPINIDYTTGSSSQAFSGYATVTITSNPVPKRAIIINIDGAKRDSLYNSLSEMPNMQAIVNNGVMFTDAKTVFPSITLASQASIFTGNYPGRHKIAGNEWFDKSSLTYRKYYIDVWDGNGSANKDLSVDVDTIYEAAKKDDMDSTVIFNPYSRLNKGTTRWIKYGAEEGWYQVSHQYDKLDSNAMNYALEELTFESLPGIMTIYFSGLDGYGHFYGPDGNDPYNQEYYFRNYVDTEIGRLLNGDCYKYSIMGNCEGRYYGLLGEGIINETVIIVVSDHGQTGVLDDDTHAVGKGELEKILKNSGYDIIDRPLESDYDAIAAINGGMAQIYIRDIDTHNWNDEPELSDLRSALDAFSSQTNANYVDATLVRYSGSDGYRVYTGHGNTQDPQEFFAGKTNYVDASDRIRRLNSTRSGDIILLASNGSYFADEIMKGEHGGLINEESYIPLIFSGPTIRKNEIDSTSSRSIDLAGTLADLLGISLPKADGSVLPVKYHSGSIFFAYPTPENGAILAQNYVYVNTTIHDSSTALIDWDRSLSGWWRFNNEIGENASFFRDWSGRGNNVTCTDTECPEPTSGKFGAALDFDGVNDHIDAGNRESLNITGPITIEAWINPALSQEKCRDNVSGNYGVLSRAKKGAKWSWKLRFGAPGGNCYLGYKFNGYPESNRWVTVRENLTPGEWYHVAGTFNGKVIKSYLNGNLKETKKLSGINGYENRLLIGNDGQGNLFTGKIDEVRIHRRALSSSEIKASYNAGTNRLYRNFTYLSAGKYNYRAYSQDLAGNVNKTKKRTVTIV